MSIYLLKVRHAGTKKMVNTGFRFKMYININVSLYVLDVGGTTSA